MKITNNTHTLEYLPDRATLLCQGTLRLHGDEYLALLEFLNQAASTAEVAGHTVLVLNLRNLKTLNSAGINVFSKFALKLNAEAKLGLKLLTTTEYPWQTKLARNLTRFMPSLLNEST